MTETKTAALSAMLEAPLFKGIKEVSHQMGLEVASTLWQQELGDMVRVGKMTEYEKMLFIYNFVSRQAFDQAYNDLPDAEEVRRLVIRKGTENEKVKAIMKRAKDVRAMEAKCDLLDSVLKALLIDRFGEGHFLFYGDFEVAKQRPCPSCGECHD